MSLVVYDLIDGTSWRMEADGTGWIERGRTERNETYDVRNELAPLTHLTSLGLVRYDSASRRIADKHFTSPVHQNNNLGQCSPCARESPAQPCPGP